MAVPSFTVYDLGSVDCPAGTLTVELRSTIGAMTIPDGAAKTLIFDDWFERGYGVRENESPALHTEVRFTEDYTVYPDGFWYKVLNGDAAELRIYLDEGAGDTFFAWGRIYEFDGQFEEVSLVSDDVIRQGSFTLVDALVERLKEVTAVELTDYLNDAAYYTEIGIYRYVPLWRYVTGMLNRAFGQTQDSADVTIESSALNYYCNAGWRTWLEMSDRQQTNSGGWAFSGLALLWRTWGWSAFDILRSLTREHGYYPEHGYNTGTEEHNIQLVGKASVENAGFGVSADAPIESLIWMPRHHSTVRTIAVSNVDGSNSTTWIDGTTAVSLAALPDVEGGYEVQMTVIWNEQNIWYVTGGVAYAITDLRFYANGWSALGLVNPMTAVANFIYYNWAHIDAQYYGFEREYHGVGLTVSGTEAHTNAHLGPDCTTQIDDGVSSRNYAAIKVAKHLADYKLRVTWREFYS